MHSGHRIWVDLLNAQQAWTTDDSMLKVIPESTREFDSGLNWPRSKALAFLNNNASVLRMNYEHLENGRGAHLDTDMLNAVLEQTSFRLKDLRRRPDYQAIAASRRERGESLTFLGPSPQLELPDWNQGTLHLKSLVQRAVWHLCIYAEWRLQDPAHPGASAGMFRVIECARPDCSRLVISPTGLPSLCDKES